MGLIISISSNSINNGAKILQDFVRPKIPLDPDTNVNALDRRLLQFMQQPILEKIAK